MTCNSRLSSCTASSPNYMYNDPLHPHAVTWTAPGSGYTHDANGNMYYDLLVGPNITYDAENRPISITANNSTTTIAYDGDGGRVAKSVGVANDTVYIGKLYECSFSCVKYIFAGSQRIAMSPYQEVPSTTYYYHADHLGSSSVVTDTSGNQVENLAYQPYGATQTKTGSVDVHHKYTSQELDDSTGLYFYGARYYDAALGRFIQPDTMIQSLRNPQSLNRYAYAANNPMRYTDPTGNDYENYWYSGDYSYLYSGDYSGGFGGSGEYDFGGSSSYNSGSYDFGSSYSSSFSSNGSSISSGYTTLSDEELGRNGFPGFPYFTILGYQGSFGSSGVGGSSYNGAADTGVSNLLQRLSGNGNMTYLLNSGEYDRGMALTQEASAAGSPIIEMGFSLGGGTATNVANNAGVPIFMLITIDAVCSDCRVINPNVALNINFYQTDPSFFSGDKNSRPGGSTVDINNVNLGNIGHFNIVNTVTTPIVQIINGSTPTQVYGTH